MLVPDSTISSLVANLRQAQAHLTNWIGGSGATDLEQATIQFDATLLALAQIPGTVTSQEAAAEIVSLRRSVGQHRGQVDREIETLREVSAGAKADFVAAGSAATARVAELETEVARLRDEMTQLIAAAREQGNQQQNAFATAQESRQEAFAKMLEDRREETVDLVTEMNEKADALTAKATADTDGLIKSVTVSKERVEGILGIVSEEALIGTYSKTAGSEQQQADRWRWITVAFVLSAVGVGIWLAASATGDGTDWDLFAGKAALGVPLAATAAYSARQSSEHRHTQREAEHMATQLATLGPYLNDLAGEETRDELLKEIAGRIFGQPRRDGRSVESQVGDTPASVDSLVTLVREVGKIVK